MNFAEFVLLVAQMRTAQQDLWSPETKARENIVDAAIKQFHSDFEQKVREEQAQLPLDFKPKVHPAPLVHPFDQEQP
jgi:hypothetical protein